MSGKTLSRDKGQRLHLALKCCSPPLPTPPKSTTEKINILSSNLNQYVPDPCTARATGGNGAVKGPVKTRQSSVNTACGTSVLGAAASQKSTINILLYKGRVDTQNSSFSSRV